MRAFTKNRCHTPCLEPVDDQYKFEGVRKNSSIFLKKLLMFEAQFDLNGQCLGHQFLNPPEKCMM